FNKLRLEFTVFISIFHDLKCRTQVMYLLSHFVLGLGHPKSIFFGYLATLSSTALVLKLLYDARDIETPYGRNSIGILLFQDIAVIPMMLSLPLLTSSKTLSLAAVFDLAATEWLLKIWLMVASIILIGRYIMPFVMEKVARIGSREVFFFFVLFACLGTAYSFHHFGLSLSLGAFVAGMLISESPYGRQATSDILPLRDNFLGLLFATIGMMLDINFLSNHLITIFALGTAIFLIKFLLISGICFAWKTPLKFSILSGLSICQIGEFSFILASHAIKDGLLTPLEHQYFLSISILSMIFTPFLHKFAARITLSTSDRWSGLFSGEENKPLKNLKLDKEKKEQGHALLVGFGVANQNLAAAFDALSLPYRIIEANYDTVKHYKEQGFNIDFGDATSHEVLKHANLESANLVIIAISGSKIIPAIISSIRSFRPDVRIIVRAQYIRDMNVLKQFADVDVLVAEVETSVELLARALKVYGVEGEDIQTYMTKAKKQLMTYSNISQMWEGGLLNLPSWESLGSMSPLKIGEDFACLNKALHEIDLR
ncbi:MAG: cation:proton antiporter, partial [Oligoflexales bacterium]|nr:cation:proton antiporter [Oligoflexales bacterium]